MSRGRRATHLAAALVALASVAATGCGSSDGGGSSALPDVQLVSVADGSTVSSGDLRGPALVNLWATWCGPCRAEMPAFQAVAGDLGDVQVLGINEGDSGDKAADFLTQVGVTFDQYLDPDGVVSAELRVANLPATIVLDADGRVVSVHSGALDEQGIRDLAATLPG